MIINVTMNNFKDVVMKSEKPVLIKFYSEWCSACQTLDKVVAGIENEVEGKVVLTQVDIEKEREISGVFKIKSTPTIVVLNKGKPVAVHVGVLTKKELLRLIP